METEQIVEQANTEEQISAAEASEQKVNESEASDSDESTLDSPDEDAQLSYDELLEKLKTAEDKANENWDLALRSKAEMENVRRRSDKDIENARKYGLEKIANEILPVKDSLDLGLKAAKEAECDDETVTKIVEGMEMTIQQMNTALDKVGIKEVDPQEGEKFNHEFHQAMSMLEMEGKESNTIVSVFQKGYTLSGRLLRPAMVVVAK
ncbi:MAG: nucleotide exchange factor GrpE [Gammaproteobacteria bacterium]|nr:nucleotide exchange factor GrpE [Gammaproteobacteria bacterium]